MIKIVANPARSGWECIMRRGTEGDPDVDAVVGAILDRVRNGGDEALKRVTAEIDNVEIDDFAVSEAEFAAAEKDVSAALKQAIVIAKANIEKFHAAQITPRIDLETMPGVRCVQRPVPIQKVGLYVPGGRAPLFSTVLMLSVPARLAGCPEVAICTPPDKTGKIAPEILYCARLCGVANVFKVGGAQAIAAMAYGTQSIPRVDKIFGPGNRYVTKAKQLVSLTHTAIDMPAGPSEVMVLADGTARPEFVAADMLSQAEHGGDSQSILVAATEEFAQSVLTAIAEQLKGLNRSDIIERSLKYARIVVFDRRDDMIAFANEYAAEHLIVSMENPWEVADRITAAGSIFLGNYSPESVGDYASGTNHSLPTAGWARSYSGVNIDSFTRKITVQELTRDGLSGISPTVVAMAEAEGLDAHANAVKVRLEGGF